ncbi:outer membrane lipoprotein-sorting protein [Pseudomonas sp. ICMP22404]|uniref:outer membrane lipoprotein-sorting protein n=1 Tax=Pseudomonas TaxID=286 RepID=UPI00111980CC|nr:MULTISPECIES: outer membrane lipoprotein-sorting protein [Pseudomonas]MCI0995850.1 outer membrane lipoprotein-sorting protein [Pseudomonas corrugata]NUT68113.1 outer membrane lipoprotein-sorting protein [Pseudomonas corrugata]TNF84094.1 outer membrane lipoprotein-sorting protein [Pseudomonas sp. ICMP22404]
MNHKLPVTFSLLMMCIGSAHADDALSVMRDSDRRMKAADERVDYRMELLEGERLTFTRQLSRLDKRMSDRTGTLVRFTAPAAVKNVALLIEDSGKAINDIWSYTPSTKSLRRLAGSQKQNWFMGTDFTYEDFEDYKLDSYQFTSLASSEPCLSWPACRRIEAKAKSEEADVSGYSRKVYYLEEASRYPVQVDYFDRQGVLVKQLKTEGLQFVDGFSRPTVQTMHNLAANKSTRLIVEKVSINLGVADAEFTQRALRTEH